MVRTSLRAGPGARQAVEERDEQGLAQGRGSGVEQGVDRGHPVGGGHRAVLAGKAGHLQQAVERRVVELVRVERLGSGAQARVDDDRAGSRRRRDALAQCHQELRDARSGGRGHRDVQGGRAAAEAHLRLHEPAAVEHEVADREDVAGRVGADRHEARVRWHHDVQVVDGRDAVDDVPRPDERRLDESCVAVETDVLHHRPGCRERPTGLGALYGGVEHRVAGPVRAGEEL